MVSHVVKQSLVPSLAFEYETLHYLGIPYAHDEQADLDFVKALARSTVIKMFRQFQANTGLQPSLFKQTLTALNAWPSSSLTSQGPWASILFAADTFKAKAYKASVMRLMLEDANSHGLAFLEYFCQQNYHLIWSASAGYAHGYEGLVKILVKKQN